MPCFAKCFVLYSNTVRTLALNVLIMFIHSACEACEFALNRHIGWAMGVIGKYYIPNYLQSLKQIAGHIVQ